MLVTIKLSDYTSEDVESVGKPRGYFAVTPLSAAKTRPYRITHIPTGFALQKEFSNKRKARRFLFKLHKETVKNFWTWNSRDPHNSKLWQFKDEIAEFLRNND